MTRKDLREAFSSDTPYHAPAHKGCYNGGTMSFKETVAKVKARQTRKAIATLYKKSPDQAVDHVNAQLDFASRLEVNRTQKLAIG